PAFMTASLLPPTQHDLLTAVTGEETILPPPIVDVSFIIPVYNEEENVDAMVAEVLDAGTTLNRTFEVVIIDDGSTDRTAERLRTWVARTPRLRVVRFRRNFGQTAATSAGFA